MRVLFIGGSQNGVCLNLRISAMYYDFPVPPRLSVNLSVSLPDEILKTDRVRYKCAMLSLDRQSAIFTECGDAVDAMTRVRDWVSEMDPTNRRRPQPVYMQPRTP